MRKQGITEEVDPEHEEIRSSSCAEMPMKYGGNGLQEMVVSGGDGNSATLTDGECRRRGSWFVAGQGR
jgi:hypothetical protein